MDLCSRISASRSESALFNVLPLILFKFFRRRSLCHCWSGCSRRSSHKNSIYCNDSVWDHRTNKPYDSSPGRNTLGLRSQQLFKFVSLRCSSGNQESAFPPNYDWRVNLQPDCQGTHEWKLPLPHLRLFNRRYSNSCESSWLQTSDYTSRRISE